MASRHGRITGGPRVGWSYRAVDGPGSLPERTRPSRECRGGPGRRVAEDPGVEQLRDPSSRAGPGDRSGVADDPAPWQAAVRAVGEWVSERPGVEQLRDAYRAGYLGGPWAGDVPSPAMRWRTRTRTAAVAASHSLLAGRATGRLRADTRRPRCRPPPEADAPATLRPSKVWAGTSSARSRGSCRPADGPEVGWCGEWVPIMARIGSRLASSGRPVQPMVSRPFPASSSRHDYARLR